LDQNIKKRLQFCNFAILGQIRTDFGHARTKTILQIVINFQFDRVYFHAAETNGNFGVINNMLSALTRYQRRHNKQTVTLWSDNCRTKNFSIFSNFI